MSNVNYSLKHKGVRLIPSDKAWVKAKNGNLKVRLIPIEKYSDIPKASGIEKKTFRKTLKGEPIQEKHLRKTKTRLNKWDRKKMGRSK